MTISIVTLFPDLYDPFLKTSLVRRACDQGHIAIEVNNMFNYAKAKERIDSPTFGHGAGLLIKPDIVEKAINAQDQKHGKSYKIFFSPQGKKLDQELLKSIAKDTESYDHIMLLPARYEGMDARVEEYYADCILSIGDYVLMGGDLPAMVFTESFLRLIPGVIGKQESVEHDSFFGAFLDYKQYTHPVDWHGLVVPDVLRSGNHAQIDSFNKADAVERTVMGHFDWLRSHIVSAQDKKMAEKYLPAHYAVLMHDQVLLEEGREGTSSVTSLDIHDIARSARTFGIKKYYIVTPLMDQQKIIKKLLSFWQTDVGMDYNASRHEALARVSLVSSLDEVISEITGEQNSEPLLIATAAREQAGVEYITYYDQSKIWEYRKPVVFIFGTARGLAPSIIKKCNFILAAIEGFSDFNHLSVRSAAAIIFDRWLGINPKKYIDTCNKKN